jgi:ABC-type cobalamin/Fe3+-siderophores transport system ATPase subunit
LKKSDIMTLRMPNPSIDNPPAIDVQHTGHIVIVGANGSGKSRLGAWFENPVSLIRNRGMHVPSTQKRNAYRISAQRTLSLPNQAQRVDANVVAQQLIRGSEGPGSVSRVQGDPVVGQNNDFSLLVNTLFAERVRYDREYRQLGVTTKGNPGIPPEDTLNRLETHWATIFPERQLVIGDHIIKARPRSSTNEYQASNLSDGERVGFYLIAHALLAPKNSTVVIDEPEIHLHESIQSILWDRIESLRTDCTFIYITHDLGFAASRRSATKIILYDYEAPVSDDQVGTWKWSHVSPNDDFPEDVLLRLEQAIFEALYPSFYVVPSNDCTNVDRSVRAFRSQTSLHHLDAVGFIDLDDRQQSEIDNLANHHIYTSPVACVENIFALPVCLNFYAENNFKEASVNRIDSAKKRVIQAMKAVKEEATCDRARYEIRRKIIFLPKSGLTKNDLVNDMQTTINNSDASLAYESAKSIIDQAYTLTNLSDQYLAVLKVFRNKSILHEIAGAFSTTRDEYISFILAAIKDDTEKLRTDIIALLPAFV